MKSYDRARELATTARSASEKAATDAVAGKERADAAARAAEARAKADAEARAKLATTAVRVGGPIRNPTKIKDVTPEYPAVAKSARIGGTVQVELTVAPDGKVADARVVKSVPVLDQAALDCREAVGVHAHARQERRRAGHPQRGDQLPAVGQVRRLNAGSPPGPRRCRQVFAGTATLRGARRVRRRPLVRLLWLAATRRRLGRTSRSREASDCSRSDDGGRPVPATGQPTDPVRGHRRDGPAHARRGASERPPGLRRLQPGAAAQRRSAVPDLRPGHDRQLVRRQSRLERPARHVHQGASRTDTAREGDVDQGGIRPVSGGRPAHRGGAVCHRDGDGHRLLRHGRAARRAVHRAVALVFPEHAVVPVSRPVP